MRKSKFHEIGLYARCNFAANVAVIMGDMEARFYDLELDTRLRLKAIDHKVYRGFFRLPKILQDGANPPSPPFGNSFADLEKQKSDWKLSLQQQSNLNSPSNISGPSNSSFFQTLFGFDL